MIKKIILITIVLLSFLIGVTSDYFFDLEEIFLSIRPIKRLELKKMFDLYGKDEAIIQLIKDEEEETYVRKLLKVTWRGLTTEAYLLIPKGKRTNCPGILALHGHHTMKEDIIGKGTSKFNVNFGLTLAEAGYVVLAPDIPFSNNPGLEDHIALNFIMTGTSLMSFRIAYLKKLLQYLHSLPVVDPKRVGCIGWSMGGGLAMYLAAVETRVKAVAISNYFGTYKDTFVKRRQTTDNYIPGILQFGEMADVACLIAPRPMWIEGSSDDPEFPIEAFKEGLEILTCCYGEKQENLTYHIINKGRHRFQGKDIVEWFTKHL